jgi:hypothetical protein
MDVWVDQPAMGRFASMSPGSVSEQHAVTGDWLVGATITKSDLSRQISAINAYLADPPSTVSAHDLAYLAPFHRYSTNPADYALVQFQCGAEGGTGANPSLDVECSDIRLQTTGQGLTAIHSNS